MTEEKKNKTISIYEIKLKGHLDKKWEEWFYDMTISHAIDGTTILRGTLPDQAVLHSILLKICDLNLTLINVRVVNDVNQNETETDFETRCNSGANTNAA